jgi:NADH-quinone oxidoreductase subunit J
MSAEVMGWVVTGVVLASALMVVVSRNLVHGVLWLGVTLLATAGIYVGLNASFVAAIQVLLYAGGVVILLIFGVMLTRRHEGIYVEAKPASPLRGLAVALPLAAAGIWAVVKSEALTPIQGGGVPVNELGRALLTEHVLAFEVLSVLLLAAMVGAIVIARRRDPEAGAAAGGEGA